MTNRPQPIDVEFSPREADAALAAIDNSPVRPSDIFWRTRAAMLERDLRDVRRELRSVKASRERLMREVERLRQ